MLWGKLYDTVKAALAQEKYYLFLVRMVLSYPAVRGLDPLWFSLGFTGVLKGSSKTKHEIGSGFTNHNGRGNLI